jgi:hypothetical protein
MAIVAPGTTFPETERQPGQDAGEHSSKNDRPETAAGWAARVEKGPVVTAEMAFAYGALPLRFFEWE